MSGIVCAIRGGPRSRSTIAEAIALAREINHPLYLLYVVNPDSLPRSGRCQIGLILERIRQLGESILLGAQEMAKSQGTVAEHRVRCRNAGEEISRLCHELDADYLVLGQPEAQRGQRFDPRPTRGIHRTRAEKDWSEGDTTEGTPDENGRFRRMTSRIPLTSFASWAEDWQARKSSAVP